MLRAVYGAMFGLRTRRILAKKIFAFPILPRPHRPRDKPAAAIGTHVMQHMLNAVRAECAFKAAYHRLGGIRRKQLITVFTGGAEFEHIEK